MSTRQLVKVSCPAEPNASSGEAGSFPFDQYGLHLLAQSDSWLSAPCLPGTPRACSTNSRW